MTGHKIELEPSPRHIRVEKDGVLLAESSRPLLLHETGSPTRYYIPTEDIVAPIEGTDTHTKCPFKGEASYYTVGGNEDIAWYYPDPLPEVDAIKGRVAFWNDRVELTVE
ncbi:MAG: DUF427 domain-containing protein [Gemmatimonadaceae bacterium]